MPEITKESGPDGEGAECEQPDAQSKLGWTVGVVAGSEDMVFVVTGRSSRLVVRIDAVLPDLSVPRLPLRRAPARDDSQLPAAQGRARDRVL
jgi:hypothetical protein